MLRFAVSSVPSKFLSFKHEVVKQPVRTWRTFRCKSDRGLQVKHKIEPLVSPPEGTSNFMYNRNPRNLERLAIANKNNGWVLEKAGRTFWHKLVISESKYGVKVSCVHQTGKVVMSASTDEWCIRKFLCKNSDRNSYCNVGRLFAQRCLQSGLVEMFSAYKFSPDGKLTVLLKEIENGGIALTEPIQMSYENIKTKVKPLRPWDIIVQ